MEVIELNEDNVLDYTDFIGVDMADNIGRTYYDGLIVVDGQKPVAGMIWELKNAVSDEKQENHFEWFVSGDEESARLLFEAYGRSVSLTDVSKTTFAIPARQGKAEKAALRAAGFSVNLMEGDMIEAKLSDIAQLPFVAKVKKVLSDQVKPLRTATQRGFNGALRRMTYIGHAGKCQDIEFLPRMFFENDVSCYSEEDGVINGLFLCHKLPSGKIEIVMMSAVGQDYVKLLPLMIGQAVKSAEELYDPDTIVVVDRHNEASLALGEKLFPTGFGVPIYVGEREENKR